ncbi:serine/threonine-protein kinase [Stenotrophomonas mori]|uniref:Serine/threonine protein kinase n=1 Tax=Stenotrophomonas mori TaxID=2871096 RepID=A0ABT0SDE2_9GAMM|nr:serine/threonine-protein kinase [Stenotrophomonas mori]MCL7713342.1 serine/threonine protein kinase [Stenotrophomonas mori]
MTAQTDQQRWQRVSQLFERLADLPPAAREALLDRECGDDAHLRAQVQRMLLLDDTPHVMDQGIGVVMRQGRGEEDDAGWMVQAACERLGHWQLQGVLGTGATGAVFAARRMDDTGQCAAVKRLRQRWDGSAQALRFLQERRILAALSHPNIPRLLDHGLDADSRPWFALQLVQGQPITDWADARRLGLPARIALFLQVAAAVQHAHAHFVVHRDLKPGNVLVDGEGHPMVLDFGVAKRLDLAESQTRTGVPAGFTPEYAAPEQITGGAVTAATDVYALGVMLYQLLAGRLPYALDVLNLRRMAEAITEQPPLRVEQAITADGDAARDARLGARDIELKHFRRYVRGDLARILQTALAKEPERRYASVEAFAQDLHRFLQGRTVSVSGDDWRYRAGKFVGRNRWGVAMACVALLALLAGGLTALVQMRQAQREAERATAEAARANHEAQRAKLEAEGLAAANEFTRRVFTESAPAAAGASLSLAQALDRAVEHMDDEGVQSPRAQVHFLLAASGSYESFGQEEKAAAVLQRGLAIQRERLPDNKDERARLLLRLAYLRMNYAPEESLAWAEEGFALQKANDLASHTALSEAYAMLSGVQYGVEKYEDALATTREGRAFLLASGMEPASDDVLASWSNEAVMLTELERYDEAVTIHRRIIELNAGKHGADATQTLSERLFLGYTFNISRRFEEGIAELEPARTGLERQLGPDHPLVQLANMQAGRAWLGRTQPEQAAELLGKAHAYGRGHEFEGRQAVVAAMYATALARAGDCIRARAVIAEAARRQLTLPGSWATPLRNTACERAP